MTVNMGRSLDPSFGLQGKTAVVTGGAAGIGAAISSTFVGKGAGSELSTSTVTRRSRRRRHWGRTVRPSRAMWPNSSL